MLFQREVAEALLFQREVAEALLCRAIAEAVLLYRELAEALLQRLRGPPSVYRGVQRGPLCRRGPVNFEIKLTGGAPTDPSTPHKKQVSTSHKRSTVLKLKSR